MRGWIWDSCSRGTNRICSWDFIAAEKLEIMAEVIEAWRQPDYISFMVVVSFKIFDTSTVKVKVYEQWNFVQFWTCNDGTVEAARKQMHWYLNPDLKHYEVWRCCSHKVQAVKWKEKESGAPCKSYSSYLSACSYWTSLRHICGPVTTYQFYSTSASTATVQGIWFCHWVSLSALIDNLCQLIVHLHWFTGPLRQLR